MPREILQSIEISNNPEFIFNSLLNPSAITEWWQAKTAIVVKENDGIYAVSWGEDIDDPDYITISIIRNLVYQKRFSLEYSSYVSKGGKLPFESKMLVHFTIIPKTITSTLIEIRQTGFPDDQIADDYFEGCKKGWNQVLGNLKKYCEKA
jgi:uncharacterized protein YndB with AHSA1/START domain